VAVECAVELALLVVEVACLPDLGGLAARCLERVTPDGVLDQDPAQRAVDFEAVGVGVGIGRVIGAEQAADGAVGEVQGQHEGAVAAAGLAGHFGHDGVDGATQELQLVERMALGLYQIGVGVVATAFAAEAPGGKDQVAQPPVLDGFLCELDGFGVAMVEVDGEEEIALAGFFEECVRFVQAEGERLFRQQGDAGLDDLKRGLEVALVGQAEADEVGMLGVDHLLDVKIGADAVLSGARLCLFGSAPDHGAEVHVLPFGEDACMLASPSTGADHGDLDAILRAHCSMITFPVCPAKNSSKAAWMSLTPKRWVMMGRR